MRAYIIRRLLLIIPLLFGVSLITFVLLRLAPGDPVLAMLADARGSGPQLTAEDRATLRRQYGLDRPMVLQYVDWLQEVLKGNLGRSVVSQRPVTEMILERLPNTVRLAAIAFVLTLAIALPLGVFSAVKQYSKLDYLLTFFSFAGISIPGFWLALMLMYLFAVQLDLLPTRGMTPLSPKPDPVANFFETAKHYILPVISMTVVGLASYMRYQRAAMLEVLAQDYVRTAQAKGLRDWVVIVGHAWRNALLPVLTLLGYVFVFLVEGSVVVETIFSWPGMGSMAISALQGRDYPLVMGIVLLSALAVLVGTLLSDILYAIADPRVRFD